MISSECMNICSDEESLVIPSPLPSRPPLASRHALLSCRLRTPLTNVETIQRLADIFATLADPTRLRIVEALSQAEFCVGDLANVVGLSPSSTSHHLRTLRNLRLVKHRREGRLVYYSLDDAHIERLFAQGLEHVREGR